MSNGGWRRALAEHEALLRYWRSPWGGLGARQIRSWKSTDELRALTNNFRDVDWTEKAARSEAGRRATPEDVTSTATHEAGRLREAVTWSVAADMVDLVAHASSSMPLESIERTDLPTPNGFLWLDKPFYLHDDSGTVAVPVRAVHWRTEAESALRAICYQSREDDGPHEDPLSEDDRAKLPRLRVVNPLDWTFGDPGWSAEDGMHEAACFLKALWAISAQRIAVVTPTRPDRGARRRAEVAGLPEEGTVRVVTLRRPRRPTPEEQVATGVDWSHRWIVEGHWRLQHLPSTGLHRQQWISSYVKGPEDKPLVVKGKVYDVRR